MTDSEHGDAPFEPIRQVTAPHDEAGALPAEPDAQPTDTTPFEAPHMDAFYKSEDPLPGSKRRS